MTAIFARQSFARQPEELISWDDRGVLRRLTASRNRVLLGAARRFQMHSEGGIDSKSGTLANLTKV